MAVKVKDKMRKVGNKLSSLEKNKNFWKKLKFFENKGHHKDFKFKAFYQEKNISS